MRITEILLEKAIRVTIDGNDIIVHERPAFSDLKGFADNTPSVRGIILPETSYFWNGYQAYHYDAAEQLGILEAQGYSIVLSASLETLIQEFEWEGDRNSIAMIENNGLYIMIGRRMGVMGFETVREFARLFRQPVRMDVKKYFNWVK